MDRLPEVFCGFSREEYVPIPNPHAERPQGWSAGAVPYLLTELLGLRPSALSGRLDIVRPVLPPSIQQLDFRRLAVGSGHVDLRFRRRADGHAEVEVIAADGTVDVRVVPGERTDDAMAGLKIEEHEAAAGDRLTRD
jgi:hypothetical protein